MRKLTLLLFYLYYLFLIVLSDKSIQFGDYGGRDTPGYIPNPEVKSASAQDTWTWFRENRSSPNF